MAKQGCTSHIVLTLGAAALVVHTSEEHPAVEQSALLVHSPAFSSPSTRALQPAYNSSGEPPVGAKITSLPAASASPRTSGSLGTIGAFTGSTGGGGVSIEGDGVTAAGPAQAKQRRIISMRLLIRDHRGKLRIDSLRTRSAQYSPEPPGAPPARGCNTSTRMSLEFYFDYSCPYAYLASVQIEALAARTGQSLVWKPFLLGGVFRALAQPQVLPLSPQKARYLLLDQQRQAQYLGVPLRHPIEHPRRTVNALRATLARGCDPAIIHAFYRAYWVEGRAIESDEAVREIAGDVNLDAQREGLKTNTDEALSRGVFGAPATFFDNELYWGEDRLWMVERAIREKSGGLGTEGADRVSSGVGVPPLGVPPPFLAASRPANRAEGAPAGPPGPSPVQKPTLDFYFDFSSPFAYLAAIEVGDVARRTGAELRLKPMLLGAVFRAVGQVDVPLFGMSEAKRQFYLRDLARWAAARGVNFTWPQAFPLRTVLPLRLFLLEPKLERMLRLFNAAWGQGLDIGNPQVLLELGFAESELAAAPSQRDALVASTAALVEAGGFGAPSFVVNGSELFWGQDRVHHVERALLG